MLILNRRLGESINIGDDIVVKIIKANDRRGTTSIGIAAPRDFSVDTEEIRARTGAGLPSTKKIN